MVLEERVSRLEGAYEQVDRRLGDLNTSMEALRLDVNERLGNLHSEMDRRFNTLYMVVGSSSVAILIAIIGLIVTVILKL